MGEVRFVLVGWIWVEDGYGLPFSVWGDEVVVALGGICRRYGLEYVLLSGMKESKLQKDMQTVVMVVEQSQQDTNPKCAHEFLCSYTLTMVSHDNTHLAIAR